MNRETFVTLNRTRLFPADQVVDIVQSEREKLLDRLDKEIHIREDEMNRKAGLEENLVTMSGYYASAGALNWVRKVLIDGSRATIRQKAGEP